MLGEQIENGGFQDLLSFVSNSRADNSTKQGGGKRGGAELKKRRKCEREI